MKKNYINKHKIIPTFFVIVFSFHAIIEGLALGIETNPAAAFLIYIAIAAHKGAESFALVNNMLSDKVSAKASTASLFLFALMTPIGIIIGKHIIEDPSLAHKLHHSLLSAVTAGTFLFMSIEQFFHDHDHNSPCTRTKLELSQLMTAIAGFIIMSYICISFSH